jgi:hypothetical protein
MPEIGTSGSKSGDEKRGVAKWPKLPRPSSTLPFEASPDVCYTAAFGGTADIGPTSPQGRVVFDPNRSWGSGIRRTVFMECRAVFFRDQSGFAPKNFATNATLSAICVAVSRRIVGLHSNLALFALRHQSANLNAKFGGLGRNPGFHRKRSASDV